MKSKLTILALILVILASSMGIEAQRRGGRGRMGGGRRMGGRGRMGGGRRMGGRGRRWGGGRRWGRGRRFGFRGGWGGRRWGRGWRGRRWGRRGYGWWGPSISIGGYYGRPYYDDYCYYDAYGRLVCPIDGYYV